MKMIPKRSNFLKLNVLGFALICFFYFSYLPIGKSNNTEPEHQPVENTEHHTESHDGNKKFDAGKMIIEHIIDAYSWHIMDIGKTQVVLDLPVILYDEGKLIVFSSAKFEHGHASYKGFKISHTPGATKGKIVKEIKNADGTISEVLPLDFSITKNVFAIFVSLIIMFVVLIAAVKISKQRRGKSPKGVLSLVEYMMEFVREDIAKPAIGKHYEKFMPYLLTVFMFILVNNLLGLIPFFPFGANVTGNIAVTGVLALFTFIITTFIGNKAYWGHIVNTPGVPWWLKVPLPLMPIIETVGVFTKPFVLMVRLFANITAGHIVSLGFISLIFIFGSVAVGLGYALSPISVLLYVFMTCLETLVALVQAYVFTLLTAIYFGMATEEHHAEHAEGEVHH